jgi:hypothetical protein
MSVGRRVNELHVDAHAVAGSLYASFEYLRDPQVLSDRLHRQLSVAKLFNGGARNDPERTDLRKLGEDVVVDAIDEEGILALVAAVLEGQNCDGGPCILYPRRGFRLNRVCLGGCRILPGFARVLVVPEGPAA